jgi:hypothetical protein
MFERVIQALSEQQMFVLDFDCCEITSLLFDCPNVLSICVITTSLLRTALPLCGAINCVAPDIVFASVVLRIPSVPCLGRTYTTLGEVSGLERLSGRLVVAATLALGNRAVRAATCAVFDGAAREFVSY